MKFEMNQVKKQFSRVANFRTLLLAALLVTFLLMVMGNVVRVSDAAKACPDWPTCYGQWTLPAGQAARLQVIHRALAALSGLLIVAAAAAAWRLRRGERWIVAPLIGASLVVGFEMILGRTFVLTAVPSIVPAAHLGLAMIALGLVTTSTVAEFYRSVGFALPLAGQQLFRTRFSRWSAVSAVAVLVLMVSGAAVVSANAGSACTGWPLCGGGLPQSGAAWLEMVHRLVTGAASLLIFLQLFKAWKSQRSQAVVLSAATGVFVLTAGQVLIGALKVMRGFPADLVGLHAASAAGLWAVQVVLVTASVLSQRSQAEEDEEARQPLHFGPRLRDFWMLSKPIIVGLLLVTTYAGMVVGGHRIPGFAITLWTLLGGALAAGGSSALNQYVDREIDGSMQRTARRPLPAGRLMPAEGLAYGLAACLAAFFLLAGFVNLIAALLSLAGMVYYVLIYSIWLKRLTVQNIVIGGGAGAIPPLVGWAAATGGLNIPSMVLFAIVFFWTPPHFWALALVRRNDYARANIPMLPVVRGEQATRWQIFIYSLELVGLTLLMPIFRITGSIYLVAAVVLGAYLIYSAWRVLTTSGNKTAWQMYKYTSMYLMLLFLALVVDVLI